MTNGKALLPQGEKETPFNMHIANIMSFQYEPVHCMRLNDDNTKLALFRGGDTPAIEIWDMCHNPFLEKVLYDLESINNKVSVESLAWVRDRLFSCGLHGFVVEHDLATRKRKKQYMATSGPVWNLAASPDRNFLGAVTEDGFVNIFEVLEDELQFLKVLDRQEGRILCLSWSPCSKYIATGSADNVRVWDVERRHAIHRLSTGRSKKNETIVWSVLIIDDLTVVSGDSRGVVSFWDGRIGVLKFKIFTHRADILCMTSSPDHNTIYVSGVDPTIVLLARAGKNGEKWVKSHQRNLHINDVLCLETMGDQLISAGVDCDLTISIPPKGNISKKVKKYPPLPKSPRIFVSRKSKRVLVQEYTGISIWQLPVEGKELVKLVDFKSRNNQIIDSACFNSSGDLFAYTSSGKMHFFRLVRCADSRIMPVKLKKVTPTGLSTSERKDGTYNPGNLLWSLHFRNDTEALAFSIDGSVLQVIEIHSHTDTFVLKPEILLEDYISPVGIHDIAVSPDGSNVAVVSANGDFNILSLSQESTIRGCSKLPRHGFTVTSVQFHPLLPYILVTYTDHTARVFNYDRFEVVFHEEIGGPSVKNPTNAKYRLAKKQKFGGKKTEEEETDKPVVEECYNSVVGTAWSSDGSKVIFHEVNKLHLMEFSHLHPNGNSTDDEPSVKRTRRGSSLSRNNRSSSPSPVTVSGQAEEWISSKLYLTKLNAVSEKQRKALKEHNFKTCVDWKTLDCEKNYKYAAFATFLDENEGRDLFLVEVRPSSLLSKLPPAFTRKRFGF